MAEAVGSEASPRLETPTHHRLLHGLASPATQKAEHSSKFFFRLVSRGIFILLLVSLVPLFPSKPPPFINQTLDKRIWELLRLLFVGIVVSYGVLGRRNVIVDRENTTKQFDNAHNYVGKIFQVPSFFGDEAEIPSGLNETNLKTWNNQYIHGEPVVAGSENSGIVASSKSRLLPVRSVEGRAFEQEAETSVDQSNDFSDNGPDSIVERFTNSPTRMVSDGIEEMEESYLNLRMGTIDFSSKIPWGSRSGGMRMESDFRMASLPPFSCSLASPEPESKSFAAILYSEKDLPSPSLSQEFVGTVSDLSVKGKGSSSSPPLPMTPLAFMSHHSQVADISSLVGEKHTSKEFDDEGREFNTSSKKTLQNGSDLPSKYLRSETRVKQYNKSPIRRSDSFGQDLGSGPFRSDMRCKQNNEASVVVRSDWEGKDLGNQPLELEARPAYCNKEAAAETSKDLGSQPCMSEAKLKDCKKRSSKTKLDGKSLNAVSLATHIRQVSGGSPIGKSVRTRRAKRRDGIVINDGKRYKEVEAVMVKKPEMHIEHIQSQQNKFEKPSRKIHHKLGEKPLAKLEDSDAVIFENVTRGKEAATSTYAVHAVGLDENEVDKKADEFIAKFREQIRLQRVESIKKSNRQHADRNLN